MIVDLISQNAINAIIIIININLTCQVTMTVTKFYVVSS